MFGQVLGRDKGSMIAIELFLFHVVTGVPLCRDMVLRLHAATRSR